MLNTLWLATSRKRLWWLIKSTLRIGTDTRASWNGHSKLKEPKHRGIILEPEQDKEEPSAVRSLTKEVDVEAGAGKTEMEATELTRERWKGSRSEFEDTLEKNY